MSAIGDLVVNLVARTQQFTGGVASAASSLNRFAGQAASITSVVAGVTGGISAIAGAKWGFELANQAEQAEISFQTLLGSANAAQGLLANLSSFAASTPYESPEVISASKQLLAFGVQANDIIPTLTMLGDVASGVGQPLGELAYLFGTAKTQGRLFSQDINQFTGRGIPIIAALAETMGVAEGSVKKMVEAGRVGYPQMLEAFEHMTASGSQFGGMMEAQSQSVNGLMSTISDNVGQVLRQITEDMMEAFNFRSFLQGTISAVGTVKQFLTDYRETLQGVAQVARSVALAVTGMTAASLAYAVAQRTATVASIMFQAAANPVMLAKVGVSLGAAAGVVLAMDAGMSRLSASTVEMTGAVANLATEANRAQTAVAGIGQAASRISGPLGELVNKLQAWQDAKPDPIRGMPDLPRIFLGDQLFEEVSTVTPQVRELQSGLAAVAASADRLGEARFTDFTQQIQDQIGQVTGISSAIQNAKMELDALQNSPDMPDIYKQLAQFEMAGATRGQVNELGGLLESLHDARIAAADLQEQMATQQRGSDFITELTDKLDMLKGTASAADITLRRLERQGIGAGQLDTIRQLLTEQEALEQSGDSQSGRKADPGFSAALTRGSAEAVAALQRGQFGGSASTMKDVATNTKKQLTESAKQTTLLASIAAATGAPATPASVMGW